MAQAPAGQATSAQARRASPPPRGPRALPPRGAMMSIPGAADAAAKAKEEVKKKAEDIIREKAHWTMKPFMGCCGTVPVANSTTCLVPAEHRSAVEDAIKKYKEA
uniref:Uncharacterized protein n=1 Tax=Zooxanthella nutricula TaxID=1333877 RepID=A0A7S2PY38_9DINO